MTLSVARQLQDDRWALAISTKITDSITVEVDFNKKKTEMPLRFLLRKSG